MPTAILPQPTLHVLVIAGTRPEVIKLAPVLNAFARTDGVWAELCAAGQHKELLEQAFEDFALIPDYRLDIMQPGQSLAGLSGRLFHAFDALLDNVQPDWVVVQGDTTTTMTAALCAFYRRIRVAHVEAGLRSHNLAAPFPEELNRRVAGMVADLHFAPTPAAKTNLLQEGTPSDRIVVTGNTVIDALQWIEKSFDTQEALPELIQESIQSGKRIVLVTGHRRENFGEGFKAICTAIRALVDKHADTMFAYVVHLNPEVREPVEKFLAGHERILLLDPLPYKAFIALMKACTLILTDSGGVQEEAPAFGKPVLLMRKCTERPEGIEAGTTKLVGVEAEKIEKEVSRLLDSPQAFSEMTGIANPFGDGQASGRIVRAVMAYIR